MLNHKRLSPPINQRFRIVAITAGFVIFCGLSQLSRSVPAIFGLVVLLGIALPLLWGRNTGEWLVMGFSGRNLGGAILGGIGAGAVSSLIGLFILDQQLALNHLGRQLLIGVPLWLFVISPFQEFFFRGWMQSSLGQILGEWWGLMIANVCFTAWHYLSPIADAAPMPLGTVIGVISTFTAGLAFGVAQLKCKNIIAPWLGHAISGIVFVIVGAMDFIKAIS